MRQSVIILGALALAPLTGCGGTGDDNLAEQVEDSADNRADAMEAQANKLDAQAAQTRDTGEQRGDAIDAADLNAEAMSEEQRQAIVDNSAAAVR